MINRIRLVIFKRLTLVLTIVIIFLLLRNIKIKKENNNLINEINKYNKSNIESNLIDKNYQYLDSRKKNINDKVSKLNGEIIKLKEKINKLK